MRLSLKYKILIILLGFPVIGLFAYYKLATNLFHEDKVVYTMNTLEANANNVGQIIDAKVTEMKNLLTLLPSINSKKSREVLQNNYPYLQIINVIGPSGKFHWHRDETVESLVEEFKASGTKLAKLIKNTVIPFTKDYIVYIFENDGNRFEILINFEQILQKAQKNRMFNVQFFNPLLSESQSLQNISLELKKRIEQNKAELTKTLVVETNDTIEAAYKTSYGVFVVSSVNKEDALGVLQELNSKSLYYLLLFIGLGGGLSVLITNKLTFGLSELFKATKRVSYGDYEVKLNIDTNDEVGILARSFNDMSVTIQELLTKLKKYNEELEQMVKERTADLNQALNLQKAMIDSLDEGFFIVNQDGFVGELRSKATKKIFGKDIKGSHLVSLLGLEESPEVFSGFLKTIFDGVLPFEDGAALLPDKVLKNGSQLLQINYSQLSDENLFPELNSQRAGSQRKINQMVCVITDKSDEYQMELKLKREKSFVQSVLSIVNDPRQFVDFAKEFSRLLGQLSEYKRFEQFNDEDYRRIHTLKAQASFIGLSDLASLVHGLESIYRNNLDEKKYVAADWSNQLEQVKVEFKNGLKKLQALSGVNENGEVENSFSKVPDKVLQKTILDIQLSSLEQTQKVNLINVLMSHSIKDLIQGYQSEVNRLGMELNRDVELQVLGEDVFIYRSFYQGVFDQMIHLFRNSIDHGYKGEKLSILVKIEKNNEIVLHYSDNGKGLDFVRLREKIGDRSVGLSDYQVAQFIFEDQISTAEKVSMLSGRGVGLSALKFEVQKIGGSITAETSSNGFYCLIQIPLLAAEKQYQEIVQHLDQY